MIGFWAMTAGCSAGIFLGAGPCSATAFPCPSLDLSPPVLAFPSLDLSLLFLTSRYLFSAFPLHFLDLSLPFLVLSLPFTAFPLPFLALPPSFLVLSTAFSRPPPFFDLPPPFFDLPPPFLDLFAVADRVPLAVKQKYGGLKLFIILLYVGALGFFGWFTLMCCSSGTNAVTDP